MNILKISSLILVSISLSCSNKDVGLKPEIGDITESVYASGTIKAEGQYTVFPMVNGVLKKVNVVPFQQINDGQLLFEIESEKAELNTENARLAYELSQESNHYIKDKIAEMELKVQAAKDKLALDESIYNRNKNIKKFNIISDVEFEKVELAFNSSKLNLQTAQKQLDQFRIQLKNDQTRNSNNLKISKVSQNDYAVKSAISGQLFDVLIKEGTLVTPQTPLAIVGKAASFLLELEVDENDMVRVAMGQKVFITMDSYKNQVFEAVVSKIYPIMDLRSRTFKIEAHFLIPPKKLYPNLTAEANIVIQTKKNTITIPKSYLINGEYVLVNKDEKRKVVTGLSDYQKVEIISGLNQNESIYLPE